MLVTQLSSWHDWLPHASGATQARRLGPEAMPPYLLRRNFLSQRRLQVRCEGADTYRQCQSNNISGPRCMQSQGLRVLRPSGNSRQAVAAVDSADGRLAGSRGSWPSQDVDQCIMPRRRLKTRLLSLPGPSCSSCRTLNVAETGRAAARVSHRQPQPLQGFPPAGRAPPATGEIGSWQSACRFALNPASRRLYY